MSGHVRPAIEELWVQRGEEGTRIARAVRRHLPWLEPRVFDDPSEAEPTPGPDAFGRGKRRLVLLRHRGSFLEHCPAGTGGLVCCNYLVLHLGSNCPMDCSYCFLQAYLRNNPALKVYTNPEDALAEVEAVLRRQPDREFRIGTGELVDSLALDPWTELTSILVPFFAERKGAVLELKTKSAAVEGLLRLGGTPRVVVSWSVNPPEIVAREEHGTASLEERVQAARRVVRAGYRVAFHFDPLVEYPGWEEGYGRVLDLLRSEIDPACVAWVSLGSLRMTPALRAAVRQRHRSSLLAGELVPERDGKLRVWRGLRVRMYRTLLGALRSWRHDLPLYLCMETPLVWEQVFGGVPTDRELGRRLAAGARW
ncbi:MAG: hypothetical protein KatS3mg076_1686 [Candidatus Binatia bacterium]|nr:MAG: hypothetical protein KatS3mg076_1686 [Candidatus Binatia bacterium]